jgi:hypothetical protein
MTDKLREAAQAALEWLRDERLNTWMYMDSQFYKDRDKQAEALEAALAEPTVQESLTVAEQKPMLEINPQKREWVGLKDADFEKEKFVDYNFMAGASFAEAKLKEKNA